MAGRQPPPPPLSSFPPLPPSSSPATTSAGSAAAATADADSAAATAGAASIATTLALAVDGAGAAGAAQAHQPPPPLPDQDGQALRQPPPLPDAGLRLPKMVPGSSQCGEEISGQPVEDCDQPKEQWTLDHRRMDPVINKKSKILDTNTDNSQKTKMEAGSSQYGEGSSGQPVEHGDQLEEQLAVNHGRMDQVVSNKNNILDKSTDNSHKTKVHNHSARLQGSAWEHSLIYGKEKGHWKCKWCGVEGYHGVTRLKWHLVGWQNLPQCTDVPKDVAKKIRDRMLSKEQKKARVSGLFVSNGSCDVLCSSKSSELDEEHLTVTMHDGCSSPAFDQANSESKALPNTILLSQESADPQECHEQQRKQVATPKEPGRGQGQRLQWQSQHELWEDLKMAGQDIIHLANNLSSLTEESYKKLVGRDRESSDGEPNGAVMTSSEPQNLVQSDGLVPSASQAFNHLAQPGPSGLSDVRNTCNQCCKEARDGSILKCSRCMLSWHISCIEPPDPSISTESWCCKSCSTTCIEPVEGEMVLANYYPDCLHGDCVICDRLEVCRSPECEDAPHDNSRAMVISSVNSVEDPELAEIDTGGSCKICGDPEEDDKRFLICGHSHCLYKYYHIRCLKSKQIAGDVQQGKPCWYCPSCLCRVCLSDKDDHLTILCDSCDEAYHLYCITPRRTSIPKGRWYCSSCRAEKAKEGMKKYERRTLKLLQKNNAEAKEGMKQYERRILKLHQKDNAGQQSTSHEGLDLLLSAMEQLSADEQLVICTN
nr:unnamed protein product [Digitaria exilis]